MISALVLVIGGLQFEALNAFFRMAAMSDGYQHLFAFCARAHSPIKLNKDIKLIEGIEEMHEGMRMPRLDHVTIF
jgi:hypothetical protein